ncbi:hypothetical protein [Geodermatophilus sp. SYSU D01036]
MQWTPDGNLLTADEGDLAEEPSGGRGWTVFSPGGEVRYASGGAAEGLLAVPGRQLFLTSNEDDGTIPVFGPTR